MPNFIRHLNASCETIAYDRRTSSSHLAVYISLFYHWNKKKFMHDMPIRRDDIMLFACMGSFNTYYRCLKELHDWGYILYMPSHHPNIPSRVTMLDITEVAGHPKTDITPAITGEPDVTPSINHLNTLNGINETRGKAPSPAAEKESFGSTRHSRPLDLKEAVDYFRELKQSVFEAEKFYNYYQGNGWERHDRTPIRDWQAVARSWILKIGVFDNKNTNTKKGPSPNHLDTDNNKDFAEPI